MKPLAILLKKVLLWLASVGLILIPLFLDAQTIPLAVVKGRVLDDSTGAPLPLANVFVANSTLGTATGETGRFELKVVPLGAQEIVASLIGYETRIMKLDLTEMREHEIKFRLRPRTISLPVVEIVEKDPVEWKAELAHFIRSFFGSTRFASECRLLNPEALDFAVDKGLSRFRATAREPLEIENRALGYRLKYFLLDFSGSSDKLNFHGIGKYERLPARSDEEAERWRNNRLKAYHGSRRHFLTALVRGRIREEGFTVAGIGEERLRKALYVSVGNDVNVDTLIGPGNRPFENSLSFCLSSGVFAQRVPRAVASGHVINDLTRAPLAKANVFIANSTLGASTDDEGFFKIANIPVGTYEIVASLLGYKQERRTIRILEEAETTIEFRLKETPLPLSAVEVVAADPVEWRRNLQQFRTEFFGYSQNAEKCRLINPEVLDFVVDNGKRTFLARAREPLVFENFALGYRVHFHLEEFSMRDEVFRYAGASRFEDLVPDSDEVREGWNRARQEAYRGSLEHFLSALARGKIEEEGFRIRKVRSLKRSAFWQYAGKRTSREEILEASESVYEFRMSFDGLVQVLYTDESPEPGYLGFLGRQVRGQMLTWNRQISLLLMNRPSVLVNITGHLSDPFAVRVYGYWSYERAAEMLPIDYRPQSN